MLTDTSQTMDSLQVDLQHAQQECRDKDIQLHRLNTAFKITKGKGAASTVANQPPHNYEHFQRGSRCGSVAVRPFLKQNIFSIRKFLPDDHKNPLRWTTSEMQERGLIAAVFSQFPRYTMPKKNGSESSSLAEEEEKLLMEGLEVILRKTLREDPGTQGFVSEFLELDCPVLMLTTCRFESSGMLNGINGPVTSKASSSTLSQPGQRRSRPS